MRLYHAEEILSEVLGPKTVVENISLDRKLKILTAYERGGVQAIIDDEEHKSDDDEEEVFIHDGRI